MNETPPVQPRRPTEKPSTLAILTLLVGLASWILPLFTSYFLELLNSYVSVVLVGLLGVVLGLIELGNIKKKRSPHVGESLVWLGIGASIASIVILGAGTCMTMAADGMIKFWFETFWH